MVLFGAFALIASTLGTHPDALKWFGPGPTGKDLNLFVIAAMGLGISLVFFVFGLILGRVVRR